MLPTVHTTSVAGVTGTENKSLVFDADLGTVEDLDIDAAEFVRYYKPTYKNGQLCLRLTLPALQTLFSITKAHEVTHENLSVIPAQYNALKSIEQDIEKGRKSWKPWKKLDAKRKIPLFVAAAHSLLSLTAVTSQELARRVQVISTQQTEMIPAEDISPTERVGKVVVPLEGLHADELSAALDEYIERHQSPDNQGLSVAEEDNDEFSDNASTIRPSAYQRDQAASSSCSTRQPSISSLADFLQKDSMLASTISSGSVTDIEGASVALPDKVVFVNIIENYYNKCMVANDSANLGASMFNNNVSSPSGSDLSNADSLAAESIFRRPC